MIRAFFDLERNVSLSDKATYATHQEMTFKLVKFLVVVAFVGRYPCGRGNRTTYDALRRCSVC